MTNYQSVLFDLDGTLADTAGDLGYALNRMLESRHLPPVGIDEIRPHASGGTRGLLALGFGIGTDHQDYNELRREFLNNYELNLTRSTILFPGILDLLETLEKAGLPWGIVTNKPHRFTLPVLRALKLAHRAACVVSGDTTPHPKPHPAPLLKAAADMGLSPDVCLYVGDDERDIEAARAAGMDAIVAMYGYLGNGKPPQAWGASGTIESPAELAKRIGLST